MGQVLIRNVDDTVIESFKSKARLKGISLEQELRNLLDANKPYTVQERLAASQAARAKFSGIQPSLTLDEVRDGLE